MKSLKLFPKIFLYTLLLMTFITAVALGTTYLLGTAPMGKNISFSVAAKPQVQQTAAPDVTPAATGTLALTPAPTEPPQGQTSLTLTELQPTLEGKTSAFYSLNADTNVAIPAQNSIPAADVVPAVPVEGGDIITATPVASYSLVRFGNLVGGAISQAIPVVAVLCLVLSALCALVFSRMIAGPIRGISAATEEMAALAPGAVCPVSSGDEIGALAEHVNSLYGSLLSNIQSLEEEKRRVEETEKSKVDFLRSASHELKTPVTALSAMLENMTLGVGKYRDYDLYLPRCREMCDRLSLMIRDILDASRVQSLQDAELPEEVPWEEFLQSLCAPYRELAGLEGQTFTLEASGRAVFPPKTLHKALGNLLGNAVCYTPRGGKIAVFCDGETFTLRNSCTPIPPENLAHIFEAFYRPDWSRDRAEGGNGLGLYMTAGILKTLGLPFSFRPDEGGDGMVFSIHFIVASH